MEGMRGFVARHYPALPRERTRFVVLDSVGSPELIVLEGEGMLRMTDYAPAMRDWLAAPASAPVIRCARAALGLRDRRADRAQGRLPHRPDRVVSTSTRCRRTTTRPATSLPRLDLGDGRRVRRRSACERCGRPAARELAGPPEGVLARDDRAREAILLELREQLAEPPSGRQPELADQLVAAHERLRAALGAAGERGAEHRAGQLEVRGDRRARRCGRASRGGRRR